MRKPFYSLWVEVWIHFVTLLAQQLFVLLQRLSFEALTIPSIAKVGALRV